MKVKVKSLSCPTLCDPMDCSLSGSSFHGIFPGKSAGVDCHFLLQGIFPTLQVSHIAGRRFTVWGTRGVIGRGWFSIGFPGGLDGKVSVYNAGDLGSVPGQGRFCGGGNGNPLQYSGLENSMDRGAWLATVHRVAKSQTWLSNFHFNSLQGGKTIWEKAVTSVSGAGKTVPLQLKQWG